MTSVVPEKEQPGGSFYFQAEDGIRDLTVTGVQTCALPIFLERALVRHVLDDELEALERPVRGPHRATVQAHCDNAAVPTPPDDLFDGGAELLATRSEEHTSELQSQSNLVCRLLLEKKKQNLCR